MWTTLGTIDPTALVEARLAAHWAAQVPAAAAAALLPTRSDFAHTNLGWHPATDALLTRCLGDGTSLRAGLRLPDLAWILVDEGGIVASQSVDGQTLSQGLAWLTGALSKAMGRDVPALTSFDHDMPEHPVEGGAAFDLSGLVDAEAEIAKWLANAQGLLERFVREQSGASEVRLWPHHFDVASLIALEEEDDADAQKSVNVGLSLGDSSHAQPYLYVSPWPYPDDRSDTPSLADGRWVDEEFFGAVLTGEALVAGEEGQAQRAQRFLARAADQARRMLGERAPS